MDELYFEDGVFEEENGPQASGHNHVEPFVFKECYPKSFSESSLIDGIDFMMKMRADLAYHEKQFYSALELYKLFKDQLHSESKMMLLRSTDEDIARCYSKLLRFEEASEIAKLLVATAVNFEQLLCSLHFYIEISDYRLPDHLNCLKAYLILNPASSAHWFKLGTILETEFSIKYGNVNILELYDNDGFLMINLMNKYSYVLCYTLSYLLKFKSHPTIHETTDGFQMQVFQKFSNVCDSEKVSNLLKFVKTKFVDPIHNERCIEITLQTYFGVDYINSMKDETKVNEYFLQKWF